MPVKPDLRRWSVFRALLICVPGILSINHSHAQLQFSSELSISRFKVDNWQTDKGLPDNSILAIAQSADGWLYFGTEEGMVRFDGRSFLLMNKSLIPGLDVNFISTLLGTRDSSLWFGTGGGGLFRLKKDSFSKYDLTNGLSDNEIFALCEDSAGGIWIGTSGSGLDYLKNGRFSHFDMSNGLANNYIRSIVTDSNGRAWVGTQKGLSMIDGGKIRNFFMANGLSDDFIEALVIDPEQNLWIGTKSGGLNRLRQGGWIFRNRYRSY